jgi:predicted AlkP superfamily phosphohydrolase/phosphomutase
MGAEAVDWSRTRAYAMGLGQIYLNLKGRERQGIVDPGEADALVAEIREKLLAIRNPLAEQDRPIESVTLLRDVYHGPFLEHAAELQIGFGPGYRISWQTALLGGMGSRVFERNVVPWSGDHCSTDVRVVPGVVLANRPLPPASDERPYHVRDIAATVLDWFGLDTAELEAVPLPLGEAGGD